MEPSADEHLSASEIQSLVEGRGDSGEPLPEEQEARSRSHLEACSNCASALGIAMDADRRLHDAIARLRHPFGTRASGCPNEEAWARLIAGAEGDEVTQLLDHAIACGDCAHRLREALLPAEASSIPEAAALRSGSAAWQRAMANRICVREKQGSRPWWRRPAFAWGFAAAAAVLIATASLFIVARASNTEELLARAYQEGRPFDFRLMHSGYGSVVAQRSSAPELSKPAALLDAEARIKRKLRANGGDLQAQRQKAEAGLLEARPPDIADAFEILTRSYDRARNDTSLWLPLACAYYLRGQEAPENRKDYLASINLLSALHAREPRDAVVLFDLALVSERAGDEDGAISAWEEFLKLDGISGYAKEARDQLTNLRAKKRARSQILDAIQPNPAAYLALRGAGSTYSNELFLNAAVSEWLPRASAGSGERAAVEALASDYEGQTRDPFLREISSLPAGQAAGLAQITVLTGNGQFERAASLAERTAAELASAGENAAAALARYEGVYAQYRALKAQACVEESVGLANRLRSSNYAWLKAQNQIRQAICLSRLGKLPEALELSAQAAEYAAHAHLPATELRARNMLDDALLRTGNTRAFWRRTGQDLDAFWQATFPPSSGQGLVFMMRDAAQELELTYAAHAFARVSATLSVSMNDPLVAALNWRDTAALARVAGLLDEASRDEAAADRLFTAVPESRAKEAYRASALLFAARCALGPMARAGDSRELARSLEALDGRLVTDVERATRDDLLVQAYWKAGQYTAAEKLAADVLRRELALIPRSRSYETRAVAQTRRTRAAKILTEIRLSRQHDVGAAFSVWQAGTDAQLAIPLLARDREAYLTWADLPDGPVLWVLDGRRLSWSRLSTSAAELRTRIEELAHDCANLDSNVSRINRESEAVYRALVGSASVQLNEEQALIVDGEELLSNAPLNVVFPARFGMPVRSAGLPQYLRATRAAPVEASAHVVVFASPAVSPEMRLLYPPLSDTSQEGSQVAREFASVTMRSGANATPAALAGDAPRAQVFHFSGHGSADSGSGALVLAPVSRERPYSGLVTPEVIAQQDWSACRLAVLSACVTAPASYARNAEPESIVSALLDAGAARVVASLWDVDSSATCTLMSRFYQLLLRQHAAAEALALAEAELRTDRSTSHPYYWAAFQLYGAR